MAGMNPNGKYAPIADIPIENREWPSKKITKASFVSIPIGLMSA